MTRDSFNDFAGQVVAATAPAALWEAAIAFARARGFPMLCYHDTGQPRRPDGSAAICSHGFPPDWVALYRREGLFRSDPLPAIARTCARPVYWSEGPALRQPTAPERSYLQLLERAGLGDGLSLHVRGPAQRDATVGLGFGGPAARLSDTALREVTYAAHLAHLRHCDLVPAAAPPPVPDLSAREREILEWIARGKSNGVIADILDLSRHTVDSMVRRIFAKLGVADRTTAVLRGLERGVLSLRPNHVT